MCISLVNNKKKRKNCEVLEKESQEQKQNKLIIQTSNTKFVAYHFQTLDERAII